MAVVVTACGGDEAGKAVAPAPATTASTSATATSTAGENLPESVAITPPGTKLKIGERAVVPHKSGSGSGTIAITVTAVDKGDQAAFDNKFKERANGIEPYFIRYTIENVDGNDLSNTSAPLLSAIAEDGRSTGVVVTGELDGCTRGRAPRDFTTPGAKYETCRLQGGRAGTEVAGAEYDEDAYQDSSITWTR